MSIVQNRGAALLLTGNGLCAREPIHIPGAIQPHGAFLASGPDGLIAYASANLAGFLGMPGAAALRRDIDEVLGAEASAALQTAAPAPARASAFHELRRPDGGTLHLRGFRTGPYLGIDIEIPGAPDDEAAALDSAKALHARLEDAGSQLELCAWTVAGLKEITGYERVMAYRFDPDGHGEVVAEARDPALEPYLGLHYPASDIPEQARKLFLRQRVGAVADAGYMQVPLLADRARGHGAPLDLTHSVLRSVSPVHRAYMQNMGTVASLTVSLVTEGELWGMLVCHHGAPRVAGPGLRAVASMTGQLVSLLLASLARAEAAGRRAEGEAVLAKLAGRLADGAPLVEALASPWLLGLVGAGGAAIRADGQFRLAGETPAPEAALQALAVLQAAAGGDIVAADDLALRHAELAGCVRHGAGALLLPLTPGTDDAILFFRPERRRTVVWGGNPTAHVVKDPVTQQLSPRASFAAWEETVSGQAAPWAAADLEAARLLGELVAGELARQAQRELTELRRSFATGEDKAALTQAYAGLLAAAPDAMIAVDDGGRIELANPLAARQFGYPLDELIGREAASVLPDGLAAWAAPSASGQVFELTGLRADGGRFPAEVTLSVLAEGERRVRIAAIRNISVRKRAELHNAKMEARYRGLLEASPDVMVMINEQEEILLLNRQAVIQFGYAPHQLTGQSVRTIIRDGLHDERPADGAALDAAAFAAAGVAPRAFERIARRKDGSEFPVEIIAGPLTSDASPPRADGEASPLWTASIRDITARKRSEADLLKKVEELNRSNIELEQFASIASHDLQEPLRIVAGYTQLLARRYKGRLDADADKFIDFAVDGATRMQQLIQDMLAYSRVGAKAVAASPTAAGDAVQTALMRLRGVIDETHALITYDQLPNVLADRRELAQLFQNLLGNAIKYHGEDPPAVHISAVRVGGGAWLFSVRDHGIGIDPRHFERIFGMFQRLHSRQEFPGTGIGLAICKKIVESHGGTIWVESAPGAGADFRFTLPGETPAGAPPGKAPAGKAPAGKAPAAGAPAAGAGVSGAPAAGAGPS